MTLNRQFLSQRHPTQIFLAWVPFPSPTASSWAPDLQQTASGGAVAGAIQRCLASPAARDIPREAPSTPAKVGQDPTSDLEPTNSHHRHDERPSASPVSTSRSSASSPPVTSATPSPGARVSLSVLTSSSHKIQPHKIQPQVINSHVALEPKPRLVEGRMTCLSLVVTRRKGLSYPWQPPTTPTAERKPPIPKLPSSVNQPRNH